MNGQHQNEKPDEGKKRRKDFHKVVRVAVEEKKGDDSKEDYEKRKNQDGAQGPIKELSPEFLGQFGLSIKYMSITPV